MYGVGMTGAPFLRDPDGRLIPATVPADWRCPVGRCGRTIRHHDTRFQHGTGQVGWLVECDSGAHAFLCVQASNGGAPIAPSRLNRTKPIR